MEEHDVKMLAWCLMGNHVHLLPQVDQHSRLSHMMRDLSAAYSKFFNWRHERVGHLMQGRFGSKPIEDEQYLKTVVRYIHKNPVPNISATCDYRWSSYWEYTGFRKATVASTELVLGTFDGLSSFIDFHEQESEPDGSLDPDPVSLSNEEAHEIAQATFVRLSVETSAEFKKLSRGQRAQIVKLFRDWGMSIRQIAVETGQSAGTVSNLLRNTQT